MRMAIFTGNSTRHKYFANMLSSQFEETLVVSECRKNDSVGCNYDESITDPIQRHFAERFRTEERFFSGNECFKTNVIPLLHGEINLLSVFETVKKFRPSVIVVFGASIIRQPMLSLSETCKMINLHLGVSPYYRGSGTNFWPFVNEELEYVGATLLHIDSGIDTGEIISHVFPKIEADDSVHTLGCRVIRDSAVSLVNIIRRVEDGVVLPKVRQWQVERCRYYRNSDFDEFSLRQYHDKIAGGVVQRFLQDPRKPPIYVDGIRGGMVSAGGVSDE